MTECRVAFVAKAAEIKRKTGVDAVIAMQRARNYFYRRSLRYQHTDYQQFVDAHRVVSWYDQYCVYPTFQQVRCEVEETA